MSVSYPKVLRTLGYDTAYKESEIPLQRDAGLHQHAQQPPSSSPLLQLASAALREPKTLPNPHPIRQTLLMTAYRPEFEAALRLFARVSEAMKVRGFQAPVLVGGAGITVTGASSPKQPVMLNLFQHLIISSRRCLSKILKQVQDDPLG